MKSIYWRALIAIGTIVPVAFFIAGLPAWGRGVLLGEILGFISYIWVGLSVKRYFSKVEPGIRRKLFLHTLLRLAFIGGGFFFAIQSPGFHILGALIGYSIIQLPAAIFRALST